MYQSYPAGVSERSDKIRPGYDGDLVVRNWLITSVVLPEMVSSF